MVIDQKFNQWLIGGWTNPVEKYARQNGNLPQGSGENKKYLSCHHLVNWWFWLRCACCSQVVILVVWFWLVVWDSRGTPVSNNPFHFRGSNRNPNHRDPNQQLTISWKVLKSDGTWKTKTTCFFKGYDPWFEGLNIHFSWFWGPRVVSTPPKLNSEFTPESHGFLLGLVTFLGWAVKFPGRSCCLTCRFKMRFKF